MIVYRPKNQSAYLKKNFRKAGGYVLILAFLLAVLWFGNNFLENLSHAIFRPVLEKDVSSSNIFSSEILKSKSQLINENRELKEELEFKKTTILKYQVIQEENERLKQILGRGDDRKVLLSKVLSKPNLSPYDTLIIDVGEDKDVTVNLLVTGKDSTPIGKIVEVYSKTSLVGLFSSPGEKLTVEIGESGVFGEAVGAGGGNFRILLPRDTSVSRGDIIKIPGVDNNVLGVVDLIDKRETETFIKIIFNTPINIYQVTEVLVVL